MNAIAGVLVVAAAATFADFVWYTFGVRHTMLAGLVHGSLLLAAVGAVLGASTGRMLKGLPIGAIAGIAGAVSYNLFVAFVDGRPYGSAIPLAWIVMWLVLAALEGRWLRAPERRQWLEVAGRGLAAAVLGGMAFYLVVNRLWGRPAGSDHNYAMQFFAWAFAWAPGLFALTLGEGLGTEKGITGVALLNRIDRGETQCILDVRSEGEFAAGHVPGAINIPFTRLLFSAKDLPGGAADELILYCGHGPRAYLAANALRRAGRTRIVYLIGHWAAWQDRGLRVER